jgi:HEPN domain-containing protein
MENKRVTAWLDDAKSWFAMSRSAEKDKFYDKGIYCLEMAMESAIKALFTGLDIEFPKTHNITHLILLNKESLPSSIKKDLEELIDVFSALLESRNASGYKAESSFTDEEFKKKLDRYMPRSEKLIKEIEESLKK